MKLHLTKNLTVLWLLMTSFSLKAQLSVGDLAVVGFNADSSDYLAFVNFVEIPPHTKIYIRDDEWNGSAFTTGEGTLSWTSSSTVIPPGTIVLLNFLSDTLKMSANKGSIKKESLTNFDISGSGEGIFFFLGTDFNTPTTFLTAIFNAPIAIAGTTLNGTTLSSGTSAVLLTSGTDIGAYKGNRAGLTKEAFLVEINKMSNWDLQDGNGNQSTDGLAPDIPFSTTPFTVSFIDTIPPSVLSANAESATTVKVTFSEKITVATAENKANYTFTPTTAISSIVYDSITKTALLTVTKLESGKNYKLSVNGLSDLNSNTQTQSSVLSDIVFNTYDGSDIVISEIMYNVGVADSLEYIEIYNKSNSAIALGGMRLYGLTGILPEYSLKSKEAVILASDSFRFNRFFGVRALYDWEAGFLNNNGGTIGLRNSLGNIVDSVLYSDKIPWDTLPDGKGPSLEIIDPSKDNNIAANWRASVTVVGKKAAAIGGLMVDVLGSPGKVTLPSGLNKLNLEADFIVYPNPTEAVLNFSKEISGIITDYTGRVILSFDKKVSLNLGHIEPGLYIIKTQGQEKKIIIQR